MKIAKDLMKGKVESFIFEKMLENEYEVDEVDPKKLLTWNRFDLAFKLLYLENIYINPNLANEVYKNDIKAQTLGKFVEFGNEDYKKSFEDYVSCFKKTYENIKENGFIKENTIIPLSADGSLINGAHRVASAIHLKKNVSSVVTGQEMMVADFQYFYNREMPIKYLDLACKKFIKYAEDSVYIAFLWPSGKGYKEESENLFPNVIYKKNISLSSIGAFNLLYELYKHMDWVGAEKDGYKGIKKKLIECFPVFQAFKVIVFQCESLEKVQVIKEKVRSIYNIGYSSVHITDTKEEATRLSEFLFNENGLHFLNNANLIRCADLYEQLNNFKRYLSKNNIDLNDVVIDGSLVLTLYGLRKNMDLDFLIADNSQIKFSSDDFDIHDSELKYHNKSKADLIYDDDNYFVFYGLKFVSFSQIYLMKSERNEKKDRNDCLIMKSSLEGNSYNKAIAQIKQKIFYLKIKWHRSIMSTGIVLLKFLGLYNFIKFFYKKLKSSK